MPRLFAAIDVPPQIRARLIELRTDIPGARWVPEHQLHMTIRFIGDADTAQQRDIEALLGAIKAEPFELALSGVGQFPKKREARVLMVEVAPLEKLAVLAAEVEDAVVGAGIAPEAREFSPHITLARLK